jgi:hypothetical protein
MPKYIVNLLAGIFLGFILIGWLVAPTGVERATWPVEMDNGSTVTVYLEEGMIDVFKIPWARVAKFSYKEPGRTINLPIVLWRRRIDECVKSCKVERSGDKIIIKLPFVGVTGDSQYEFTPIKPPPPRTEPPGLHPAEALAPNSSH